MLRVSAVTLLLVATASAADPKSGPQPGDKVAEFAPLNLNGEDAGEKSCQVCRHASKPVAVVFVRTMTPGTEKLLKALDAATVRNVGAKMGSFLVLLDADAKAGAALKAAGEKAMLAQLVLCTYDAAGPDKWNLSADANVTVVLYVKRTVKANFAFGKEIDDSGVAKVLDALKLILPDAGPGK